MLTFLQQNIQSSYNMNSAGGYAPILIQGIIILSVVTLIILGTHLLGPKRKTKQKLQNFECGYEQEGDARQPMSIKYFVVAILFVLFDVEVVFFYPYAVNFKFLQWNGFFAVLMFVVIFLIGFYYIIRKNVLSWDD